MIPGSLVTHDSPKRHDLPAHGWNRYRERVSTECPCWVCPIWADFWANPLLEFGKSAKASETSRHPSTTTSLLSTGPRCQTPSLCCKGGGCAPEVLLQQRTLNKKIRHPGNLLHMKPQLLDPAHVPVLISAWALPVAGQFKYPL